MRKEVEKAASLVAMWGCVKVGQRVVDWVVETDKNQAVDWGAQKACSRHPCEWW